MRHSFSSKSASPFSFMALLRQEETRRIFWAPVLLGLGASAYFHAAHEPNWRWLLLGEIGVLASVWLARGRALYYPMLAVFLIGAGACLAQRESRNQESVMLSKPLASVALEGRIIDIAPGGAGAKITLDRLSIPSLAGSETPTRARISVRRVSDSLQPGMRVHLRAGLFPLPTPATPGGFDFRRYFYFSGIGATGYAMGQVTLLGAAALTPEMRFSGYRHALTDHIRRYFHEPAGAVAAAFITGETRAIPDEVNDAMRVAGLYHLLAVSGMNLSVVAGLAFFSFRLLFASIPALGLRYPIKKWAALLALLASYLYLRVAGAPVSAERAFYMVALVFIAILCDREPMPLRSVALAACFVILHTPDAVLSASFQLSFSATAALIASYEWGKNWTTRHRDLPRFSLPRIGFYFAAVAATSLIAWLGTEPFILYHFSQFSCYSLFANTIAEPLVSFLLMPLVIAGVLLMPLGLAALAFTPLQYGVDALLALARFTAHLPHAMIIAPPPSDSGFLLFVLGLTWLYFSATRLRALGLIPVLVGLASMAQYTPPDLFVRADGKQIALRRENGAMHLLAGRPHTPEAQAWLRAALTDHWSDADAICGDDEAKDCLISLKGQHIMLHTSPLPLLACPKAALIVTPFTLASLACATPWLDAARLAASGTAAVTLEPGRVRVQFTGDEQQGRPWSGAKN